MPLSLNIDMSGVIEDGDAMQLVAILNRYKEQNFREINVTLNSPGGTLSEGLKIGRVLASRPEIVTAQVGTLDSPTAECASACVLIYLGADLRYLAENGRIGVHQFYDPTGALSADTAMELAQRLSSEIVLFLEAQRVNVAFFERMAGTVRGIDWVPRRLLGDWRVITGSVFDERMEYKNINGKVGLHMIHESLYGTNQMTLYCDNEMIAYTVLDEPKIAAFGAVSFVLDGADYPIDQFEVLNRDNGRTRMFFTIPKHLLPAMKNARTIGARVHVPSGDIFWGFEQNIRDDRVRETVDGCISLAKLPSKNIRMIEFFGMDFLGGDITRSGIRNVSFEQCKQICLTADACHAVSYVSRKRWCWPKGATLNRRVTTGVVSAIKP